MSSSVNISVVIPLYNKQNHVQRAIRSVLAQTYPYFELIIVDDGSTDGSFQAASEIYDERIRIIRQSNQGVSAARNRGVAEAQYEWVAFLDADDEWLPNFLELILNLHQKYPECLLLASAFIKERESGLDYDEFQRISYPDGWEGVIPNYYDDLCQVVPFCSSSFIVKKSLFNKIGGFYPNIHIGEDINLWLRLYQETSFAYSKKMGAIYHLEAENRCNRPLSDIFSNPVEDYSHGNLVRSIIKKCPSKLYYQSLIELLAMYQIPIVRKLIQNRCRKEALVELWSFRSTKKHRKKWIKLVVECLLTH